MAISAENLACERGERLVFRGLSFALRAGEALVLRGPNGSGKSSLLRLCAALLRPAEGRLCWDGADVWQEPDAFRARLAYVGHLDGVKPLLTAWENVAFWASLRGGGDAAAGLDAFGVAHLAELPARFLSAGQKKRVALARLVAAPAALWLLDEPTVSLDEDGAARLAAACAAHRARGGTIVAATHVELGFKDARTFLLGGVGGPGRPAVDPRVEPEGDKKGSNG